MPPDNPRPNEQRPHDVRPDDPVPGSGRRVVATEDQRIEVVEEIARIEKRVVESGSARVHVTVSERDEAVEALLTRQDVHVERVPVNQRVDSVPPVRQNGDTIIVPVMEEQLVIEKRLIVREELHIRIDVTKRPETHTVRLRREHAEIERGDTPAGPPTPLARSTP